ncbi:MAG: DUF1543 domain-containing protein [Flavobacterium sp.]|nr:DUF1543 domain-containing protein [Flavobacterium sp.]
MKLFMIMLGCRPRGRFTEQHDIFFGIANSLKDLIPQFSNFWPNAGSIHIDAWREVTVVDNYKIEIVAKGLKSSKNSLFFINLGGYKENEFEEYHYKIISVDETLAAAQKKSKQTAFFKHCGFGTNAVSHIDDKFGIDIDDSFNISEILMPIFKDNFDIELTYSEQILTQDELHIGYVKLAKIK